MVSPHAVGISVCRASEFLYQRIRSRQVAGVHSVCMMFAPLFYDVDFDDTIQFLLLRFYLLEVVRRDEVWEVNADRIEAVTLTCAKSH